MADTSRPANRLIHETSPYLLQHAYNPVDWYPWGPEAFEAARSEDKPVFLSIGYSACHWCHVMEHESFEDPEIAKLMNRHFINIKVDREERPDLDQIYMQAVLAITGQGGWPMSVFLTPEGKPFFGGTYWPPEPKFGRAGFPQILESVHEAWQEKRSQVDEQAGRLTEALVEEARRIGGKQTLSEDVLENAAGNLLRYADRTHGGFGRAPKFPHPFDLRVLLRCWKRFDNREALDHVILTLDKMARGGIYDHLGGGFHRYSTDAHWLVPHFEKMLYDNALLVPAYLEAYQAAGKKPFAEVVHETLEYVLREMTQPEGGFYSTQDADSEGEEGKFFVWTSEEIEAVLGADRAKVFNACYDVGPGGNWEGKTILNLLRPLSESAADLGREETELRKFLQNCREELFEARKERIAPGRDEKILVSWNGLMIAAMSLADRVLGEPDYSRAAQSAADFILNNMRTPEGGLWHSYKDGKARFNAYLDDYAAFIDGLAELYQATMEPRYLEQALELSEQMISRFADQENGGFYYTAADHEELIVRQKDTQDNATPSGNAMAATALLKLSRLCGRSDLEELAVGTLEMLSEQMQNAPAASGQSLIALDFLLGRTWEAVAVDGESLYDSVELVTALDDKFVPNKVLLHRPFGVSDEELPPAVKPILQGKTAQDGRPTVYLCEHGTCRAPIVDSEELAAALEG